MAILAGGTRSTDGCCVPLYGSAIIRVRKSCLKLNVKFGIHSRYQFNYLGLHKQID